MCVTQPFLTFDAKRGTYLSLQYLFEIYVNELIWISYMSYQNQYSRFSYIRHKKYL